MVRLSVVPHRGNSNRIFPSTGYLGLTPVSVQGHLRTQVEEDNLQLEASSVQVRLRCYESESKGTHAGKAGDLRVLYEVSKTLWTSGSHEYRLLGDFEAKFRLTVPVDAILHGAVSTMIFKSWRIWWSLEAVVHHRPAGPFGSRLIKSASLNLVSFAYPPPARHLAWDNMSAAPVPLLRYAAETDSDHYGPGQSFSLRLTLKRTDLDPALSIKKITVELHREVVVNLPVQKSFSTDSTPSEDSNVPSTPSDELPPPSYTTSADDALVASPHPWPAFASGLPSPTDILKRQHAAKAADNPYFASMPPPTGLAPYEEAPPALMPSSSGRQRREDAILMSKVLQAHEVAFSSQGEWTGSLTNSIPRSKTIYHWAVGESCSTPGVTVRFYVTVKIAIKSRLASLIELPSRDVSFQSIIAEERAIARDQVPKVFAIQTAETRMFEHRPGTPRRSASTDSASLSSLAPTTSIVAEDVPAMRDSSPRTSLDSRPSIDSVISTDSASLDDEQRQTRSKRRFASSVLSLTGRKGSADSRAADALPQARRASVQPEKYNFLGLAKRPSEALSHKRTSSSTIALHFDSPATPTSGVPLPTPATEFEPVPIDPLGEYNFAAFSLASPRPDAKPARIEGGRVVSDRKRSRHGRRASKAGMGPTDPPASGSPLTPTLTFPNLASPRRTSLALGADEAPPAPPPKDEDRKLFGFLRRGSKVL